MNQQAVRFTFKDLIFLISLLVVAYIVSQKVILREQLKMPTENMRVHIIAEGVRQPLAEDILIGDAVYQKGAMFPFGRIVDKEVRPARKVIADEHGQHQIVYAEQENDVALTISAPGFVSLAGSPIIDNTFFYSNQYLPIITEHAMFTSRVIQIRKD
ncbi:hypothetical protein BEP19_05205 [Ammoniphilus oxalaticus]|uniref:Uncharacterized protein n=1 Tax=Ammoniphilus oxalaticus TaxID=66863 RepID=A0A419SIT3_9BACL|nr:hypothetical protein [Ammoniphilus oxalaticus]RKD23828.1 hypothetical protein BEP19_05205 [Ammoniphilus oxalaticus]